MKDADSRVSRPTNPKEEHALPINVFFSRINSGQTGLPVKTIHGADSMIARCLKRGRQVRVEEQLPK